MRALTGELGLTGESADKVATIFDRVANSSGSLDKAFSETTEGAGFKFAQLLSSLQRIALQLGEALLPAATAAAEVLHSILVPLSAVLKIAGALAPIWTTLLGSFLAFKLVAFLPDLLVKPKLGQTLHRK